MQFRFFFHIHTKCQFWKCFFFLHKPYKSYCRIVALQAGYKTVWQLCNIPAARKIKFFQIGPLTIIEVCPFVWNKMLNYMSSSSLFNLCLDGWIWVWKKIHVIQKLKEIGKTLKITGKKMNCKPTFISVWEIFARIARAVSSRIFLAFLTDELWTMD